MQNPFLAKQIEALETNLKILEDELTMEKNKLAFTNEDLLSEVDDISIGKNEIDVDPEINEKIKKKSSNSVSD